ncbi:MAG: ADP-ribosyl-[dinitrogen reductase] hydrolase [Puniceicoccales bacterium]|jgi:ADP-ribosyl-[dinitrogen reductase] hydrolase|nr:ADP-ribosyl-[dinitrogen reductase] hydrolase [Puniceicoccales bacterium]
MPSHTDAVQAPSLQERFLGAYLGFASGDALGATVEFMTAGEIRATFGVHNTIRGGGWLRLKPGQITDDTQMCLAVGDAMIASEATGGWDLRCVADGFVKWLRSRPVDIGNTCRRGIRRYMQDGSLHAPELHDDAGNGALMRNLPVALGTPPVPLAELLEGHDPVFTQRSLEQGRITHGNILSDASILMLGQLTRVLLAGGGVDDCHRVAEQWIRQHPKFNFTPWPGRTSGYVVDTVQTVLDGFFSASSLEECIVSVVNRGGDADTTGALAGQLAGARWGIKAIPTHWVDKLDPSVRKKISEQVEALLRLAVGQ